MGIGLWVAMLVLVAFAGGPVHGTSEAHFRVVLVVVAFIGLWREVYLSGKQK